MDEQTRNETMQNIFVGPARQDFPSNKPQRIGVIKKISRFKWLILAVVAVIAVVIVLASLVWQKSSYDQKKWQAVFLNNNQVYFGHVAAEDENKLILREIYYPQKPLILQQQIEQQPADFTIVKFGGEIYGTEDEMVINRENVLYVANIKEDSKIVAAIKKYQEKK